MVARRYVISAAAALAGAATLGVRTARAAVAAGEVVALRGNVFDGRGGHRVALKSGDPVFVGDIIEVPEGAKIRLRMSDGSILSLASGSKLTITAYGTDAAGHRDVGMDLASGLLRAVVAQVVQPARFEVRTATGVAAVRSTDWFARIDGDVMQVGVLKGRVALINPGTGHEVVIPARWGARMQRGLDPVPPRLWTKAEFADVIGRTDVP